MKHFFLGCLFGALLGFYIGDKINETPCVASSSDTIEVSTDHYYVDTFLSEKPVYYAKKYVDTFYLPCADSVAELPIEQVEYHDSTYNAWVSGYKPSLDSIKVYNRIVHTEHVKTIRETQIAADTKKKIFLGVGVQRYEDNYVPNVNVYLSKKDFLVGVTAGIINSKPIYGINVNYKIK